MSEEYAYRIIKWSEKHSNHEQKRSGGRWICCPTSFDSLGLQRLLRSKRGVEAFGVYVLLAELAAKMPTPGVMAGDDGRPLTTDDIAIVTGVSTRALDSALALLQSPSIAWIDRIPTPVSSGRDPDSIRTTSGRNPPSRAPACAPADDRQVSQSVGQSGECEGERARSAVIEALESRLGRQCTASDTKRVVELVADLEREPLEADGKTWPAGSVLAMAIGAMPPDVRIWWRYLSSVIENCRADNVLPGALSKGSSDGKRAGANISRVAAKPGKYAKVGQAVAHDADAGDVPSARSS